MAAVLLSNNKIKTGSAFAELYPMWGKGAPIIFWAGAPGRVHCRDAPNTPDDCRFASVHWREMAHRVQVFSQMTVTLHDGPEEAKRWQFERQRAQKWMDDMVDVIREAKAMVNRQDDADFVRERRLSKSRIQSGDLEMERKGVAGRPIQKRIILPDNLQ